MVLGTYINVYIIYMVLANPIIRAGNCLRTFQFDPTTLFAQTLTACWT